MIKIKVNKQSVGQHLDCYARDICGWQSYIGTFQIQRNLHNVLLTEKGMYSKKVAADKEKSLLSILVVTVRIKYQSELDDRSCVVFLQE